MSESSAELAARGRAQTGRRVVMATALVLAGGLLAVITAGSIARSRQGFSPDLISGVLLLMPVLIIVVLFVLGRNLIKLYLERSRGAPGSGYRVKVVSLVVGFTLLPSLLLFFIASGILQASVDQWFRPEIKDVYDAGKELLDVHRANETERALHLAQNVAQTVREGRLMRRKSRSKLQALLDEKRGEYKVAALRVYDRRGQVVAESYDERREERLRELALPERSMTELLEGHRDQVPYAPEKKGELLLFFSVPIPGDKRVAGALALGTGLGGGESSALARIAERWEEYHQARAEQESVKQGFVLVLAFFTLLLVFSAIWVGSALSKSVTVPIQSLAEATLAVAEGRFDHRVDVDAPDELGVLVRSFNRMLEELRVGKLNVERSTSDLRLSNIELEGRRRYIETILAGVPNGVISLDQDGRFTNYNQAALQMLGLEAREVQGAHYSEIFGAKEYLELHFLIDKVMGIREISLTRDLHLRLQRRSVNLAVSFTALRDAEERYIGLILVLEDLSNLIKAQKIAAWREVARRIAHEIKNPLTPIQLSAQRISKKWRERSPDLGRVIEDCTTTITQEVDGLKTLVNEFSRFARMPPVSLVPTQIDKVIHNALVLYEGLHRDLVIERHIAADIPTLNLDPEQTKRVLINLLDNAIHCQSGRGRVEVTTTYDARTQSVRLEVADEGPGIPPEDRDKLFVPYFSTRKGGTGLGLAIVHRIVSDHNGRIRVEENLPHGTRFVIDLPA